MLRLGWGLRVRNKEKNRREGNKMTQTIGSKSNEYEEITSNHRLVRLTGVQSCHWARKIEMSLSHQQNIYLLTSGCVAFGTHCSTDTESVLIGYLSSLTLVTYFRELLCGSHEADSYTLRRSKLSTPFLFPHAQQNLC
jgi:hypothetical protein